MSMERRTRKSWQEAVSTLPFRYCRSELFLVALALYVAIFGAGGCGQTAPAFTSAASGQVTSYFGGPFNISGSSLSVSATSFDHSANKIAVSGFANQSSGVKIPVNILDGAFAKADTGFLGITENFAMTSTGLLTPLNPSLSGAWAVEIPGAGAIANLLSVNTTSTPAVVRAAPIAMAQNTSCPDFATPTEFLYVAVPEVSVSTDTADYGLVNISSVGSAVTFATQPFLVGSQSQPASTVTGGCSVTNLGALTAYPLNSFATTSNLELISMGTSGFLVSSFNHTVLGGGAFGGGTGVIGVAAPSGPVNVSSVVAAQYNGFIFSPRNTAQESYDITVLASSFGNDTATSQACSALEASLVANNGQGNGSVSALPSANSIYGGEFLTTSSTGSVNDPTGSSGSENCDVVVDLGTEDSTNNGLFPNATVFVGSNFPPFSASNPWACGTGVCAVSFPAAAIVGQVQGQFVIFVSASGTSSPPAVLPDQFGNAVAQPAGIYLFQKM